MRNIHSAHRLIIFILLPRISETMMPAQWKYLLELDIYALNPVTKVMNATVNITVTAADFSEAFRKLPELLTASWYARKLHASSLIDIPTLVIQSAPESGAFVGRRMMYLSSSRPLRSTHHLPPCCTFPFWRCKAPDRGTAASVNCSYKGIPLHLPWNNSRFEMATRIIPGDSAT